MLNDLRRLFRQSVEAFRTELNAREPEDQVTELLAAMRRELVAARAAIPEYEADAHRSAADLAREREALAECERRGSLAERIDDRKTVAVAGEFAARHRERIRVLEKKVAAAEAELELRRREADEMMLRYREADTNRFALLAQLRRSVAQDRLRTHLDGQSGPMADWERMEHRVGDDARYVDALEELEREDGPPPPRSPSPEELDERLRELKRRMGRE